MAKKAVKFGPPLTMAGLSRFPESLTVKCEEGISLRPGTRVGLKPGEIFEDRLDFSLVFNLLSEGPIFSSAVQPVNSFPFCLFDHETWSFNLARRMSLAEAVTHLMMRDGILTIHADPPMKARPPREGRKLDLNFRVYAGRRVIFETEMLVSAFSLQPFIWLKDEMPGLKREEE